LSQRHCLTDVALAHRLQAGGDVAHLARRQAVHRLHAGAEHADLHRLSGYTRRHHAQAICLADHAIEDAHVSNHALVRVVVAVEDQRACRGFNVALWGRDMADNGFQHLIHIAPGLGADLQHVGGVNADQVFDLLRDLVGPRSGQIGLIGDRHDLQVLFEGHVQVGQRLRLDTLRAVHDEHRALACLQRPADLVGEVHVAGRVNQVHLIGLAIAGGVAHAHRRRFDRHAALAF